MAQYLERHSLSSDMKKSMSLREGLHVMTQCYMRTALADRCWLREHLRGRSLQKMRSESSEYVRKTTGFFTNSWRIKIALESYFEEHAQEVWERNWMNLEMRTTLLNKYPPKLIATILKALREKLIQLRRLHAQYQKSLLSMIKS